MLAPSPARADEAPLTAAQLAADPVVPPWLRTWGQPIKTPNGRAYFFTSFGTVDVWARPRQWGDRIEFTPTPPKSEAVNFGVNLADAHQASGTLVTTDPDIGGVAFGADDAANCPARPDPPPPERTAVESFIAPGLILGAAVLVGLKVLRK
jgi:hypothetical protein